VNEMNDSFPYTRWTRVALPIIIGKVRFQSRDVVMMENSHYAADELFMRRYPGMTTIYRMVFNES
jgi:hypothetical protein